MSRIEGDYSARESRVADGKTNQVSKYAAARYRTVAEQTSDRDVNTGFYGIPEYQSDVSDRRYEIAAWLQDERAYEENGVIEGETEQELEPWESEEANEEAEKELDRLKKMLESLRKKKTSSTGTKKRLSYSYQRVSSTIRVAKTVLQASNALSKANSTLSLIRRQAASGQYNEQEIRIAKTHAAKMVRTARSKVRHLKAETYQKSSGKKTKNHAGQKMNTIVKNADNSEKLRKQQQKQHELQKLTKKIQTEEKRYQNRHRRKENWDLMQADMEYLLRRITYLKNQDDEEDIQDSAEQSYDTTVEETAADSTKMFTASEQSVILKEDAVDIADTATTVKENLS